MLELVLSLGWQHSPAARPVRWTVIVQALVRDRIPLEVGTLPRARVACVQLFPGKEQSVDQGGHTVPDLTLGSRGAAVRIGVRTVILILSGFFPALEMWARGQAENALEQARVKGVGDM